MTFSLPLQKSHWKTSLIVFLTWTALAAIFTTKSNLYYTFQGISTSWIHLSIHHLASAWTWVLFMPFLYWGYRRLRDNRSLVLAIFICLFSIPLVGALHRLMSLSVDVAFRKYMGYIEGSIVANLQKMDSLVISGVFDSAIVFVLLIVSFVIYDRWNNKSPGLQPSKFQVKHNGEFLFIEPENLMAVTAQGNYVKLHIQNEKAILIRNTMNAFMAKLSADNFIRVNRSHIINIHFVKSLRHKINGDYVITLDDGLETTTSKRFDNSWRKLL